MLGPPLSTVICDLLRKECLKFPETANKFETTYQAADCMQVSTQNFYYIHCSIIPDVWYFFISFENEKNPFHSRQYNTLQYCIIMNNVLYHYCI